MRPVPKALLLVLSGVSSAPAAGLIMAYEAEMLPELDGWTPLDNLPGDPPLYTRGLADGVLTIDVTARGGTKVSYSRDIHLLSNDVFFEWRSRTSNNDGGSYVHVLLESETSNSAILLSWRSETAAISLTPDVGEAYQLNLTAPLAPGEFHTFRVESDGPLYTVYVDGIAQLSAELQPTNGRNAHMQFGFTKTHHDFPTRSEWDYIRIGVIPEPATLALILPLFLAPRSRPRLRPR